MSGTAWRQGVRLWAPALGLLLLNLAVYASYRVFFADQARSRESQVERASSEYEQLAKQRERAQTLATHAQQNQDRLVRLYANRLKTEKQRITKVIAEVKALARQAGLDPAAIQYPDDPLTEYGLTKRSIVFGVDGSYLSLRKFVNFLELTQSFLVLEEILPGGRGDENNTDLSINLKIATLFLAAGIEPLALARSRDTLSDDEL